MRQSDQHFGALRRVARGLVLGAVALAGATALPGPVEAQEGLNGANVTIAKVGTVNSIFAEVDVNCVTPADESCNTATPTEGSVTIKASAATKRKLKLTSTTLGKAPIGPYGGGHRAAVIKLSAKNRSRINKYRSTHPGSLILRLTVTVKLTGPVVQTQTRTFSAPAHGLTGVTFCTTGTPCRSPFGPHGKVLREDGSVEGGSGKGKGR